ncbi:nitroreductase family protein [Candidatus Omnitrophota bacterium]
MKNLSCIENRYSCRSYDSRAVEEEKINIIMEAACKAPSACNKQPWRYFVVTNEDMLTKLREKAFGPPVPNTFVNEAPVLIAVGYKKDPIVHGVVPFIKGVPYQFIDVGISTDHLMLQATECGLGTCWIGWFNVKVARKILNISPSIQLCGFITLGYPADESIPEKKRRPTEKIVSYLS